jgi:transcriptional regulator with XRE-family HTH domain
VWVGRTSGPLEHDAAPDWYPLRRVRAGTADGFARGEASFGDLLRELRTAAGLTQEGLAERARLSPNAVGALERGQRRRPYPHTVRSLADALGLGEEDRAALRGEAKRSALLIGAAEESLREVGAPVYNFYAPDPSLKERASAGARATLGNAAFEELREQGRAATFEEAVTLGAGAGGHPAPR